MKAKNLVPLVAGVVFALGLGLSGMTLPGRVLAFLDVTGAWDPSLALVMGGALAVASLVFRSTLKRPKPLLDVRFHLPTKTAVDGRLVVGAALFGIGWGLAGYCPGPALVGLAGLAPETLVFVAAMVSGMAAFQWVEARKVATGNVAAPARRQVVATCT